MTPGRCTSWFSIAWVLVVLGGCGAAMAQDVGAATLGTPGLNDVAWFVDRYGLWGAVLAIGWRALGIIDRVLTKAIDAGQAAAEAFTTTGAAFGRHVERLLEAGERGELRVVVEHRGEAAGSRRLKSPDVKD